MGYSLRKHTNEEIKTYTVLLDNARIPTLPDIDMKTCTLFQDNKNCHPFDWSRNEKDNFKEYDFLAEYKANSEKRLFLYGPTGTGKTHIAIGFMKRFIWKNLKPAYYINQLELSDLFRNQFNEDVNTSLLYQIEKAEHILLDDFGEGRFTPAVIEGIENLIFTRLRNGLLTDITSNLSPSQIDDIMMGNRITSRLSQHSYMLELSGKDYRLPF